MSSRKQTIGTTSIQKESHARAAGSVKEGRSSKIFIFVLMILICAYFVFPLLWLLIDAMKSTLQLFNTPMLGIPRENNFLNNVLDLTHTRDGIFWRWYFNSLVYATSVGIGSTFISAITGYTLSKYRFRFRGLFIKLVLISLLVPAAALTIPIFLIVRASGMMNTYLAVIIPLLLNPFGIYFMMVYSGESMPSELIDAGRIDGANDYTIFLKIALPIIRPGLVTLFLLAFIGTWNNFFLPLLVVSDKHLMPATLGIYTWVSTLCTSTNDVPPYPFILMGSLLSILPMLIFFPFLRKHIAAGMISGGLKE
jgi:multiple sugar transport system permease protein